jgi:hypothetical protein
MPSSPGARKTITKGQAAPKKKTAAAAAKTAAPASAAAAGPLKSVLGAMEKAQLVKVITDLVKSGAADDAAVRALCPKADTKRVLKNCSVLVNAITKAMGRYANGDDFCWKRAKGAVGKAKRALLDGASQFRKGGDWAVALAFATEALVLADKMPTWHAAENNSARADAIAALEKLEADAVAKLKK